MSTDSLQCNLCATAIIPEAPDAPSTISAIFQRIDELVPTNNEVPNFRDDLERTEFALLHETLKKTQIEVDVQLETLRSQYQGLLKKRSSIARDVETVGKLFVPSRLVPNEVLRHIFIMARDKEAVVENSDTPLFMQDSLESSM